MKKDLKNIFRKFAVLGVAAAAAFGAVGAAACNSDSGKTKITFWGWGSTAEVNVYKQLVDEYMKENKGVSVKYTHYSSDIYMDKFTAEKKKPDVFFMPETDFLQWADTGVMLELDDYLTETEVSSVWPQAMEHYYYNGSAKTLGKSSGAHLYGLPKDLGPYTLVYNKDLLDRQITANGLDRNAVYELLNPKKAMTWAQFRNLLKDLTRDQNKSDRNQIYGIPYYEMESALYSNNADYFYISEDGQSIEQGINKDFIDAVAFNVQLATVDKVMPDSSSSSATNANTRFLNQKTIFTWMGPWNNADFWGFNINYEIVPVPYNGENKDARSVSYYGSMCYGISADSKEKEAAIDFAKWLSMGKACQTKSMNLGQQVPNLVSMVDDYISADWEVQPANRSLFVDMIDGNTNSIGLYDTSNGEKDEISSKMKSLYFAYDGLWKKNLESEMSTKKVWDMSSYDSIKNALEGYSSKLQSDLNSMLKKWKKL